MDTVECVVVGAGVVGLAIARSLSNMGVETIILEQHNHYGGGVSSRNSEVIHAGIYYQKDSLKARLCVDGRNQLYAYCEARNIPHRRTGKLIVAVDPEQIQVLESLNRHADENGVCDLRFLEPNEVHALEPDLAAATALLSPSTGIVDSHALMTALLGEAEDGGAVLARATKFVGARPVAGGMEISTGEEHRLVCRLLINSAGLQAVAVARSIEGLVADALPASFYAKGSYFSLSRPSPFSRLIYPVPEQGGLGVHLTLDLAGQARFGPDVEWIAEPDYAIEVQRGDLFYAAIRRYWPALPDGALQPAYVGVRPKLSGPREPAADFMIKGPECPADPPVIGLFGIESPGLTSSLAIGDRVAEMALDILYG